MTGPRLHSSEESKAVEGPEQDDNTLKKKKANVFSDQCQKRSDRHLFRIPAHQQRQIRGHDPQDIEGSVTFQEGEQAGNQPFAFSDLQEWKKLLPCHPGFN